MSRARIVYALLITCCVVTFAQSARQIVEPQAVAVREPERSADTQSRRASLRAMLKSQPDNRSKSNAPAKMERQLTDKERADLRQQLRQQLAGP